MGGTSTSQQNSQQQSQLTPWAPVANQLQGLVGQLPTDISASPQVSNSLAQLYNIGQQANPLAAGAMGAAGSQLGGAQNYGPATGILGNAYNTTQQSLSPYTSGNAMDPSSNPALAQQLATVNADVSGQVNPLFAAAGRLASPDNAQALARGITQGSTGILQNAATNQLNAINTLQNAAGSTAGGLLGADVANAGIQSQGISNAPGAYGVQNLGPTQSLTAAMTQQQLPYQNASTLEGLLGPLAAQFGQQNQTGSQTGSQTMSPAQQAWGWINSFANLGKMFSPSPAK